MKLLTDCDYSQADPFIFEFDGKYYLYSTYSDGVRVCCSNSLLSDWQYCGYALKCDGQKEFWAPCVIENDGLFYMYYSSMLTAEDDVHRQCIRVAVSDNPLNGFVYKSDLLPSFSIDPHVVRNESGLYIFYSKNNYEGDRAGTYIVVDKMTDYFSCLGEPADAVLPSIPQEIYAKNRFKDGQDWYTIEGACYFFHNNRHYCMYSGNNYQKKDYFVGYAVSDEATDRLNGLNFRKYPSADIYSPLLCSDDVEQSTGHNSVICVDGQYYVVYHARDIDNPANTHRTARICKLVFSGKTLRVEKI